MIGKPKILVVDDDLAALELIAGTLQSLDVRPCCVQSSRAAAELISKEKFDGIFLDWLMPEMDGLELAHRIRQSKRNSTVPIVMLTVETEPEAMERAFGAGVNFYLGKPVTAEKVERLLNVSRGMILEERRRHQRVSVSMKVLCAWNGQQLLVTSVNLSASGILLRVPVRLPKGVAITLSLELPGGRRPAVVVGKVIRIVPGIGVGMRFTKDRPVDRKRLAEFVEKSAETQPPEKVF